MPEVTHEELWNQLLELFEEKLQLGLLTQARAVSRATFESNVCTLEVISQEAFDFFQSEMNQRQFKILSRPVIVFETVLVTLVEEAPSEEKE